MDKARFLNMVRSLYNIDSFRLPELSKEDWKKFVANPLRYFIQADATQQAAIFREVEHRQKGRHVDVVPARRGGADDVAEEQNVAEGRWFRTAGPRIYGRAGGSKPGGGTPKDTSPRQRLVVANPLTYDAERHDYLRRLRDGGNAFSTGERKEFQTLERLNQERLKREVAARKKRETIVHEESTKMNDSTSQIHSGLEALRDGNAAAFNDAIVGVLQDKVTNLIDTERAVQGSLMFDNDLYTKVGDLHR